ncbi:nuclear transport factor 2 family protein [Halorubrum sp. AJ67]|uniref:nuclear transport factor 2 family protein n=1 Tax=Halorubrum sp. AJ67 TaxID=1173487 RepID=UPI00064FA35C|nr:nuclear transport factor 2 family protein [Halorubrum sp. AJ67]
MTDATSEPERLRETVHSYYERVDADDYDGLLALFADDIVYDRPGQDSIEGIDALERFYREDRPLSDGEHEVLVVAVDGDTAAVRGTFGGRQGGERVAFGFADFHTVDADGLIAHRVTYTDRDTV